MEELEVKLEKAVAESNDVLTICIAEKMIGNTKNSKVLLHYASALKKQRRYDEAIKVFEKLLENCSEKCKPWLLHDLAEIESEKGKFKKALKIWLEAHQLNPKEATFLIFASTMAFRLGKFKKAEKLARMAANCQDGCIDEAFYNLGVYLTVQLAYKKALKCYEKAIEISPEYKDAIKRRDDLLETLKFEKENN